MILTDNEFFIGLDTLEDKYHVVIFNKLHPITFSILITIIFNENKSMKFCVSQNTDDLLYLENKIIHEIRKIKLERIC